jgi:hypothetical protein
MLEIVTSTIAVLFEPLSSPPKLDERDLTAVFRRPLGVGQTPDGQLIVSSSRDQAEVILGINKVDVRDLSGDIAIAKTGIPKRLRAFLELMSNPIPRSFGLNFIIEFAMADSRMLLANNLLDSAKFVQSGTELRSDSVSLIFKHNSGKSWTLRFSTPSNEAMTLNFNASEEAEKLPDGGALGDQFETQYQELVKYVKFLKLVPDD